MGLLLRPVNLLYFVRTQHCFFGIRCNILFRLRLNLPNILFPSLYILRPIFWMHFSSSLFVLHVPITSSSWTCCHSFYPPWFNRPTYIMKNFVSNIKYHLIQKIIFIRVYNESTVFRSNENGEGGGGWNVASERPVSCLLGPLFSL